MGFCLALIYLRKDEVEMFDLMSIGDSGTRLSGSWHVAEYVEHLTRLTRRDRSSCLIDSRRVPSSDTHQTDRYVDGSLAYCVESF